MSVPAPHFLLFSEASDAGVRADAGRWRFVLEALDGSTSLEAADDEAETSAERLELLAIVRGLEALDQPSRVTLITRNSHISRGLRYGLEQWRENDWQWERFGQMTPVKNGDLWRRIDQAVNIHRVDCRSWKLEASDDLSTTTPSGASGSASGSTVRRERSGRILRIDRGASSSNKSIGASRRTPRTPKWRQWLESLNHWLAGQTAVRV